MYSIDILVFISSKFICLLARILLKKKSKQISKKRKSINRGFLQYQCYCIMIVVHGKNHLNDFFALNCDTLDKIIQRFCFVLLNTYVKRHIDIGIDMNMNICTMVFLCLASFHLAFHWYVIRNANEYMYIVCVSVWAVCPTYADYY